MRVVYEVPIWEKIIEACRAAEQSGMRIDYIELTKGEMTALYNHVRPASLWLSVPGDITHYYGVRVKEVA